MSTGSTRSFPKDRVAIAQRSFGDIQSPSWNCCEGSKGSCRHYHWSPVGELFRVKVLALAKLFRARTVT